jgi:hypothetical protein
VYKGTYFREAVLPTNRTRDRQFVLALAGTVIMAVIVGLALAPRNVRAHMAGFAEMGTQQLSSILAGNFGTPHNRATASATHGMSRDKNSEYWPAGTLFEAPPNLPAVGWTPSVALVHSVFGDTEIPAADRVGDAGSLRDSGYSASGGWPGRQSGNSGGYGNSGGGQTGMAGGSAGGSSGSPLAGAGPGSRSEPGKPGDLASFHEADPSGGSLLTGTDTNALGSGIMDSKSAGNTLSAVKTIVTGMDDPFSVVPEQVLEAPTLPSGSGSRGKTSGYGKGWTPGGGGGTGNYPLTSGRGSPTDYSGNTGGGGGNKNKDHPSGDLPGLTQSALTDWGSAAGDLGDPSPGLDEQAVPEPGSLTLFVTALLAIVVVKLRSTRTA